MKNSSLRYNQNLFPDSEIKKLIHQFKQKGFVILPNVFERESVKKFKTELEEIMFHNGISYTIPDNSPHYMAGALAPRGRQILPHSLSDSIAKPMPSIHTTIIVIETDKTNGYAPDWNKDRQPDGMPGKEYHFSSDVFLAFYFEDITEEHGPTQIIPGSHQDNTLNPYNDSKVESILLNMEDALLIDQRAWHRGISRKAPGTRFVIVYGMYALPQHYGTTFQMPHAQIHHWMNADNLNDRVYFGGPFAPPTKETIEIFTKELNNSEFLINFTFPKMS